jgi:hypothetical protein
MNNKVENKVRFEFRSQILDFLAPDFEVMSMFWLLGKEVKDQRRIAFELEFFKIEKNWL